jgi:hypothetical protein
MQEDTMQNPITIHRLSAATAGLALLAAAAWSQPAVELPRPSPLATVSQSFGYSTMTVTYSRPGVKGRAIWGGLVPYGQIWRAGANEATLFEASTDVKVEGKTLPKGKYALYILPTEKDWTFIFSKNHKAWGSYTYDQKEDALRVTVVPKAAPHQERLEYSFADLTDSSATFSAHWEKLKGTVNLTVEFMETAKANIKNGLPKAKPDDQYAWLNAARFYWSHNIDRKQAMEWVDKSIAIKPIHANLWTKAEWLAEQKKFKEARETAKKARAEAEKDPNSKMLLETIDKTVASWK